MLMERKTVLGHLRLTARKRERIEAVKAAVKIDRTDL